jgi:hypothetical protein
MICFVAIMPKLGVCVVDPVRDHDGVGQGDGVVDGVSDTESEPLSESLGAWLVLAERVNDWVAVAVAVADADCVERELSDESSEPRALLLGRDETWAAVLTPALCDASGEFEVSPLARAAAVTSPEDEVSADDWGLSVGTLVKWALLVRNAETVESYEALW